MHHHEWIDKILGASKRGRVITTWSIWFQNVCHTLFFPPYSTLFARVLTECGRSWLAFFYLRTTLMVESHAPNGMNAVTKASLVLRSVFITLT